VKVRPLVAFSALVATILLTQIVATPRATDSTVVPLAVYRGADEVGVRSIADYEVFVGRRVTFAVVYQDVDTVENQTWPDWQADAWRDSGKRLVIGSTGIGPESDFAWAAAARGAYDAQWRVLGERLVQTGQSDAVLRGAHEFNGDWFFYSVRVGEQPDFVAAWRRWVGIMRAVPGNHFTFDWNPIVGDEGHIDALDAYPGDAYVDRIALDVYDGYYERGFRAGVDPEPSDAARDAMWTELLDGPRGLQFWHRFAVDHDKPLSLPEWGIRTWPELDDGLVHGGGDNAAFVHRMARLIEDPSWNVDYHGFWEDPDGGGSGVFDPDAGRRVPVPGARAAFLEEFGTSGSR
jgi:hypothetical protein